MDKMLYEVNVFVKSIFEVLIGLLYVIIIWCKYKYYYKYKQL